MDREDFLTTRNATPAGRLLGVEVVDHIIAGAERGEHYSFHEHNGDLFQDTSLTESLNRELKSMIQLTNMVTTHFL